MLERAFYELGLWNWMVLGLALLVLELLLPGVFLLWIGIAALLTGALTLQLWDVPFWTWHIQVLVFLALSIVSVVIGRRIINQRDESDQPLLNRRADQLVGRTATLTEPIRDGYGRMRIGDTVWRIAGPDVPAGTKVRVVRGNDTELVVEAV
ncbi:MAG: NfeD family protein [Rhizobiaceae bacterium]|nr:NfeD family protein [Rhizobiaceae bacterium]